MQWSARRSSTRLRYVYTASCRRSFPLVLTQPWHATTLTRPERLPYAFKISNHGRFRIYRMQISVTQDRIEIRPALIPRVRPTPACADAIPACYEPDPVHYYLKSSA